ncbi:MAG: YggT family protein [Gammaproteobacteria bacterium]|nr:YggT family protein [Gammaproteobacteria bacterium]
MVNTLSNIGIFIFSTVGILFLFTVLLRFMLQLARADFYNPIAQGVVTITNPFLRPLRRVIPGVLGFDMASVVLALLAAWLLIIGCGLLGGLGLIDPFGALLWSPLGCLMTLIAMLFVGLLISIVASWVAPHSRHPALIMLHQLLEPVCGPVRRIIPSLGVIDISPIFVFILLTVADKLLFGIAQAAHMPMFVYQLFWHIPSF